MSVYVVGVEHHLSHLPDVTVCESGFGRKDPGVSELCVMSQTDAIPCHVRLIQVTKTGMLTVLTDPSVN
jgi:hypothetical protein